MNRLFGTFDDVDAFLGRLPMFGKTGPDAARFGLERMEQFLRLIGNPQHDFKSIHVAGTNGKGTVCRLLASVYQEAGYTAGLYTSPHLTDYRDRFLINGIRIEKTELLVFFQKYGDHVISQHLTYFELSTAIGFWFFSRHSVDIAIIETGLGGRLDATNVIRPEACVITSVGLDHTEILGDTLGDIAAEKAGIIKEGVPLVTGNLKPEADTAVRTAANKKGVDVIRCSESDTIHRNGYIGFQTSDSREYIFPAEHWKNADACNFVIVWNVITQLQRQLPVHENHFREGVLQMSQRFRNRAVFERVSTEEDWYFDGAHNPEAVTELINKLLLMAPAEEWNVVLSFMSDKLTPAVATLWNQFPNIYLFDMNTQRGASMTQMRHSFPGAIPLNSGYSGQMAHFKSSLVIFSGSFYFYSIVKDWMGTSPA